MNMAKPATTLPSKRERTRIALLEAAIDLIAERGLDSISIDDLTRSAGMARGTFYNYFETREEVVQAVSLLIKERVLLAVMERVPADYNDESTVACILYGFLQFTLDHPNVGWALVRIGGNAYWISGERCGRADLALQNLLGETTPLLLGRVYIEGVMLMILRHRLEGHMSVEEAEQVLRLTWRGLGMAPVKIQSLMKKARAFAQSIHELRSQ
jgi:AcrR family transcriptional regulator